MNKYILLFLALLLSACGLTSFDDSDQMVAVDKTVTPDTVTKITSHLLAKVPAIREEKNKLIPSNNKVKLSLSITASPDPSHTKNDPDYRYHAEYYWVYVNYRSKDKLLKYDTYLVHKDLNDIYRADSEKDTFVKVGA